MRRMIALSGILGALVGAPSMLRAQGGACNVLCAPVFVAQPGIVVANALNAPEVQPGQKLESSADFLFRVTTVVPTELPRIALVGIVQWTPFAKSETIVGSRSVEVTTNSPSFVYGPVFQLFTAGPLGVTFDALGVFAPSGVPDDDGDIAAYKHQFLLELDLNLNLGDLFGSGASPFLRGMSAYAFLAQQMTDRPVDFRNDAVYSPVLLFGLTVPIAPLP